MTTARRLALFFACIAAMPSAMAAEPMPEYAMKAAFLYNFALFTEWPEPPEENLNLCVLGKDGFGAALDAIDGKPVNGLRLTVRRIGHSSAVQHCQILFLGETAGLNIHRLLVDLEEAPILTVTDNEELMPAGIMIGMLVENQRLMFEINVESARRARLSISSKLLRLARTVY